MDRGPAAPPDVPQAAGPVPGVAPDRRDGAEPQAGQLGHVRRAGRDEAAPAAAGDEQLYSGDTEHWGAAGEYVLTRRRMKRGGDDNIRGEFFCAL